MPSVRPILARLAHAGREVRRELAAFGAVGTAAFVIDNGAYNLLVFGLPGHTPGALHRHAVVASAAATAAATLFSWLGNRFWTYRHQRRDNVTHELILFAAVNVLSIGITALPILLSRSVLGFSSVLSDNVARLLGWAMATAFRFISYRRVVFPQRICRDRQCFTPRQALDLILSGHRESEDTSAIRVPPLSRTRPTEEATGQGRDPL